MLCSCNCAEFDMDLGPINGYKRKYRHQEFLRLRAWIILSRCIVRWCDQSATWLVHEAYLRKQKAGGVDEKRRGRRPTKGTLQTSLCTEQSWTDEGGRRNARRWGRGMGDELCGISRLYFTMKRVNDSLYSHCNRDATVARGDVISLKLSSCTRLLDCDLNPCSLNGVCPAFKYTCTAMSNPRSKNVHVLMKSIGISSSTTAIRHQSKQEEMNERKKSVRVNVLISSSLMSLSIMYMWQLLVPEYYWKVNRNLILKCTYFRAEFNLSYGPTN